MKIIKEGDLSKVDTTRRFECPACGCVWDANPSEYGRFSEKYIYCECPTCHKLIWRDED